MTPLRRHALAWLSQPPLPERKQDGAVVEQWHADGLPFVVCRQRGVGEPLSLGFCLALPGLRPRRIAVQARHEHLARVALPPSIQEVAAVHPGLLDHLSDSADNGGLDVRVFGSWMWQTLTGVPHVNESSDLDVLIDVASGTEAARAAAFLQRAASDGPLPLDGELSLPGLGEIHWREYLSEAPSLLLKALASVRMIPREDLWM